MEEWGIFDNDDEFVSTASEEINIDEEALLQDHPGYIAYENAHKNELSVLIADGGNGTYYISGRDLEKYMEMNSYIDPAKSLQNICERNRININDVCVILDESCSDFVIEELDDAGILTEKAVEDDAMTLGQVKKWYNKFVAQSKNVDKETSKKEIEDRIAILQKCVNQMKKFRKYPFSKEARKERFKYALKGIIPFNDIYRFIKHRDAYAGVIGVLGAATQASLPFIVDMDASVQLVLRTSTYDYMLDSMIKNTEEAIEFLKEKLKEYD